MQGHERLQHLAGARQDERLDDPFPYLAARQKPPHDDGQPHEQSRQAQRPGVIQLSPNAEPGQAHHQRQQRAEGQRENQEAE